MKTRMDRLRQSVPQKSERVPSQSAQARVRVTQNAVEIDLPSLQLADKIVLRQIQVFSEKEAAFKVLLKRVTEQKITAEELAEELFLGNGLHVDGRPREALLWAAVHPNHTEEYRLTMLEMLLNAGGNPHTVNVKQYCQSLLAHEAAYGRLPTVKLLLSHGANVNQADTFGITPLANEVSRGNLPMVKFLLDSGADVNQPDVRGITPLNEVLDNWAHRSSHLWKVDPAYKEIAQLLKSKGARRSIRGYFQAKRAYLDRTVLWQKLLDVLGFKSRTF